MADPPPRQPFTPDQVELIKLSMVILNPISIVLNTFVALTYLAFKRKFPHVLVFYFSVSAIVVSVSLLISPIIGVEEVTFRNPKLCYIQGVTLQFSGAAVIWCWFFIAVSLYLIVVFNLPKKWYFILHIIFHIVTWVMSFIQTAIPSVTANIGVVATWCWVDEKPKGVWQFTTFYGQMCILTVIGWFLWLHVILKMCCVIRRAKDLPKYISGSTRYMLSVISVSLIFVIMFSHRIFNATGHEYFPLALAHSIALSALGFPIFLTQGLTIPNLKLWWFFFRDLFARCFCQRTKREPPLNNPSPNSPVLREPLISQRWSVGSGTSIEAEHGDSPNITSDNANNNNEISSIHHSQDRLLSDNAMNVVV